MNHYPKPISEYTLLEKSLAPGGTPFQLSAQKTVFADCYDDEHNTLFLQSGTLSIFRQQDGLLIEIITAPFIFGINAGMMDSGADYTLVTQSPCTGFYLPAESANKIIQQDHLWREAFCWLSWNHRELEIRDQQLIGNNSYSQIRAMLIDMADWDETLRSRIGVMSYIQQRTRISRSVVAEVLAALRQGNYINMSRGKLVSINRLPAEY